MIDVIHTAVGLAGTAILLKIVTDTFTRHKLINKGLIDEKVKYLFTQQQAAQPLSSMKWGMVLVAIGLALLLKQFWPGYVADDDIQALLSGHHLVVAPYRSATQSGIAPLAFAVGRPVVTTRVGSLAEVVIDGVTGTLAPGRHQTVWDGRDRSGRAAAAGVYFVRLTGEGKSLTAKMVLAK